MKEIKVVGQDFCKKKGHFKVTSLTSHFVPLRLALRGYSVASLPRRFAPRARILSRFAPSKFSKKKSVSQSTQNGQNA